MKLLKTVRRLVEESEKNYIAACDGYASLEEVEKAEKNYKNSLKILEMVEKKDLITKSNKKEK